MRIMSQLLFLFLTAAMSACASLESMAHKGDIEGIKARLSKKAATQQELDDGLYGAIKDCGSKEMAKLLLDHGANINSHDERWDYDWTPLGYVAARCVEGTLVSEDCCALVSFLLDNGADPTAKTKYPLKLTPREIIAKNVLGRQDPARREKIDEILRKGEVLWAKKERQAAADVLLAKKLSAIQAAEKAGDDAKTAGKIKEALAGYREALKETPPGTEPDRRLREKIIAVAAALNPPPAVPEEAESLANRGQSLIKRAQNAEEMQLAVSKLQQATLLAPWWATAYFNLGLAQERAEDFDGAMQSLRLYLLAAPNADDVKAVRRKLDDLAAGEELAKIKEKSR